MHFVAELAKLRLKIGEKHIFKDITMSIPAQGITVLLGPSGTGKSTLLRILTGQILDHSSVSWDGKISVAGQAMQGSYIEAHAALVGQKASLLLGTVWESLVCEWSERSELTQQEQRSKLASILHNWGQQDLMVLYSSTVLSLTNSQKIRISIIRKALSTASLLMLDEPTANLSPAEDSEVLNLIKLISKHTPMLVVTHKINHAQHLADQVVLIASGVVQEQATAENFFFQPKSENGQQFIRTGSCVEIPIVENIENSEYEIPFSIGEEPIFLSNPVAQAQEAHITSSVAVISTSVLSTPVSDVPQKKIKVQAPKYKGKQGITGTEECLIGTSFVPIPIPSLLPVRARGPRGFTWIIDGQLAGTPMPGLLANCANDLQDLHDAGTTHLLSLTEEPFPASVAQEYGISCSALPIPDMGAPSMTDAIALCRWMDELFEKKHVIAVHCRAGLGRTGTILCMYWCWLQRGTAKYQQMIDFIRSKNSGMIQSVTQEVFLEKFSDNCAYLFSNS